MNVGVFTGLVFRWSTHPGPQGDKDYFSLLLQDKIQEVNEKSLQGLQVCFDTSSSTFSLIKRKSLTSPSLSPPPWTAKDQAQLKIRTSARLSWREVRSSATVLQQVYMETHRSYHFKRTPLHRRIFSSGALFKWNPIFSAPTMVLAWCAPCRSVSKLLLHFSLQRTALWATHRWL